MASYPALLVQPPQQQDLLGQLGKVMALKTMMQNQAYQQQMQPLQLQQAQAQAQITQLEMKQRQMMMDIAPQFVQKDSDGKPSGFDQEGFYNALEGSGIFTPDQVMGMRGKYAEAQKQITDAGTSAIGYQQAKNKQAYEPMEAFRSQFNDPNQTPDQLQKGYQTMVGTLQHQGFDTSGFPQSYSQFGQAGLDQQEIKLGMHEQQLSDAAKQAETRDKLADAGKKEIELNWMKNTQPGSMDNMIAQATQALPQTGPVNAADVYQRYSALVRQYQSMGDMAGVKSALDAMNSEISGFNKEKYTQAAISYREAQNRAAGFQYGLQGAAIKSVDNMWSNPQNGYVQMLAQTDATKAAVSRAENGDILANALVPTMTILGINSYGGTKRISPSEVAQWGQMGGVLDRLNITLQKYATGKVPKEVRDDVNNMIDSLVDYKYKTMLAGTSQTVANAPGLDAKHVYIMDKAGNTVSLADAQAKQQQQANAPQVQATPPPMQDGVRAKSNRDGKWHWVDRSKPVGQQDMGLAPPPQ